MSRANPRPSEAGDSPGARRVTVEALLLTAAIRVGLSLASFRSVRDAIGVLHTSSSPGRGRSIDRVVGGVDTACRYVPRTTCLVKAMSAQALLRRYGYPAELRVGVRRVDGNHSGIEAHAWVESEGEVVVGDDEPLSEFVQLPSFDEAR